MRRSRFVCLLIVSMLAAIAAGLPTQGQSPESATPESTTWRQFNQVFVKAIMPVTPSTPRQDGPAVESWVAEELKQQGVTEYFALTDWVPVCDGLLADNVVDNDVWDGGRIGEILYCDVDGDLPQRENGQLLVKIGGWLPGGCDANITLADEPGNRAVGPVQILSGGKPFKTEVPLPYVAVLIAPPPPQEGVTSDGDAE